MVMDISEHEDYCCCGPLEMQPQDNLDLAIEVLDTAAQSAVNKLESLERAYKIALVVTGDEEAAEGIGKSMDKQIDIYSQCMIAIEELKKANIKKA